MIKQQDNNKEIKKIIFIKQGFKKGYKDNKKDGKMRLNYNNLIVKRFKIKAKYWLRIDVI